MSRSDHIPRKFMPTSDIVLVTDYGVVPMTGELDGVEDSGALIFKVRGRVAGIDQEVELTMALMSGGIPLFLRTVRGAYVNLPIEAR